LLTTVVVPAYNTGDYLSETLASVLRQTDPHWVLNVVDDGSTDGTAALASSFAAADARIRVLTKANGGMANARNWGAQHAPAESDAVLFLDHDDLLKPDALEVLRAALQACPEASAAHGLAEVIDADGAPASDEFVTELQSARLAVEMHGGLRRCDSTEPTSLAMLAYRNCILTMGQTLMRRSALEQAGPFVTEAAPCDDYDLYLRLAAVGPLAFIDRTVVAWRRHEGNASRNSERMAQSDRCVRRRALARAGSDQNERRLIQRGWQAVCRNTARRRLAWALGAARDRRYGSAALEVARCARDVLRSHTVYWMER
jgi:glycosyltransferase involved in cell wall biosynthesis